MSQPSIEYLAGYFNGEGSICFDVRSHRPPVLHISIQSGDFETLKAFEERFGGKVTPVKRRNVKRQLFNWSLSGVLAQIVLHQIEPFLIEKQVIARLALQCDFVRKGFKCPKEEWEKRLVIAEQVSAFNNRVTVN